MDNFTHSLIGAALGQTGLKRLSGLGMPTLIIAANIPDIDATCTIYGTASLAMRRGVTHGPIAMIVLPLLLTGAMIAYDRWQARRGKRPKNRAPVRFGPLLLLAVIGTLSHPLFDWLNSYGIRLLEPFSREWFYGDTLFIIDVWIWALLIGGWIWSRRAERTGGPWQWRGQVIVSVLAAYVFANGLITRQAEAVTRAAVSGHVHVDGDLISIGANAAPGQPIQPDLVVANPVPLAFWHREMLWRGGGLYGLGSYDLFGGVTLRGAEATGLPDARVDKARVGNADLEAFLFWSRMPVVRLENGFYVVGDQRFMHALARERFSVKVPAK